MGFELAKAFVSLEVSGLGAVASQLAGAKSSFSNAASGIGRDMGSAMAGASQMFSGMAKTVGGAGSALGGIGSTIRGLKDTVGGLAGVLGSAAGGIREIATAGGGLGGSLGGARGATASLSSAMGGLRGVAGGLLGSLVGVGGGMRGLHDTAGSLAGSLGGAGSVAANLSTALGGLRASFSGAGAAMTGMGRMASGTFAALRGGISTLGSLGSAASSAGRSLMSAASSPIGAAFQKSFSLARSAVSGFASAASSAMSGFKSAIGSAVSAVTSAASSMGSGFAGILSSINPLKVALIGLGAVVGGAGIGIKLASDMETTEVAFGTMLKSADKAKEVLGEISEFAAKTPFEFPELAGASRKLLAFGTGADELMGTLSMIGDVASGVSAPIGEIAEIFGKARVQGRLFQEDINQFDGRGIPLTEKLKEQFGVTGDELRKMTEQGKIGFSDLERAFASLTEEGGQFFGMTEAQSHTAAGQFSTLIDNVKGVARMFGDALLPALKGVMGMFNSLGGTATGALSGLADRVRGVAERFGTAIESAAPYVQAFVDVLFSYWGMLADIAGEVFTAIANLMPSVGGLGASFLAAADNAKFFFTNWRTYLAIAFEEMKLFTRNSWEAFKALIAYDIELVKWFGKGWKDILLSATDVVLTIFINLGTSIREIWNQTLNYIAGQGFDMSKIGTDMLKGTEQAMARITSTLPKFVGAAVQESTDELKKLYGELGMARVAHEFDKASAKAAAAGKTDKGRPEHHIESAHEAEREAGKVAFHGLEDYAKHIQQGINPKERAREDREIKALKIQEQQLTTLKKVEAKVGGASPMVFNH